MKLTFRKREVKDIDQLQALVAENAEAIEPGFRIIATNLSLGRSAVELAGLDAGRRPVLISLGLVADDAMMFRMVEAYAWCLEYPDAVQRFADDRCDWPPRVAFIAERLLESFLRKMRLLKFPRVDCFEYRYVEVNETTGFYLDPVDWARSAVPSPAPAAARAPELAVVVSAGAPRAGAEERVETPALAHGRRGTERARPPAWLELLPTKPADTEREWARDEARPAASVAVVAEPPVERARVPLDRVLLDEIEVPGRGELAPSWRKFLDKLTGTFEVHPAGAPTEPPVAPAPVVAAAPAAPVPATVVRPLAAPAVTAPAGVEAGGVDDAPDRQRVLLEGLTLPSNGELAPQWRKFLDKPAGLDEGKVGVVREYLQREFPMCTVYDFHEFQRDGQVFQIQDSHGKVVQLLTVTGEFLDDHREGEIRAWSEKHKLAQAMRQAGQAGVLLSKAGLVVDRR
ncbi:MAG: hypothetical protein HYV94_10445 [Candidatus Rokubacteria bacterium]|nr:hypothetical protein [Candidatus Rokubacteria bacterium]MBI2492499.1 hypothetical protein [Candidatus Rokubacteria bacterium]MBI4627274.1 hypothetical protein [Candidatus Rokubacteria bacterium]